MAQLWLPQTSDGGPLTAQLAGFNWSGLIGVVVCPSGHRIPLYNTEYQMDRWGHVWPEVWCTGCDWQADVNIDDTRRVSPYREM